MIFYIVFLVIVLTCIGCLIIWFFSFDWFDKHADQERNFFFSLGLGSVSRPFWSRIMYDGAPDVLMRNP